MICLGEGAEALQRALAVWKELKQLEAGEEATEKGFPPPKFYIQCKSVRQLGLSHVTCPEQHETAGWGGVAGVVPSLSTESRLVETVSEVVFGW